MVIFVALHGGGLNMDLGFIRAVGEIKMHKKVIGIEFPKRNEVYIRFEDTRITSYNVCYTKLLRVLQ